MFRCKKDVDRHVQEILRKLKNESEKYLRSYNIAKLYYQVGDFELTKKYVSNYLEVRRECPGAHKLLGEALEGLGQKEAALAQYITSLELEARQDALVLKVCELLSDSDISMDVNRVRYWVERADQQFPHNPIVFQLKEKMLSLEKPNDSGEDLEALIASELSARPTDVHLRVKLLKHYTAEKRLDDAYNHAVSFEETYSHRNSIVWYQALSELLKDCEESKKSDWSFWIFYISSLERYASLSLKEEGESISKSVQEAMQAVFNFDKALLTFKSKNFTNNSSFTEHMLSHMWGQLHLHLACLILRKTKREQGSWNEARRLCGPLLLNALQTNPIDPSAPWSAHLKDWLKKQVRLWYREGSYRCSQAGHVLQDYGSNNSNQVLDKIDKFCTGTWRERIYQRIFTSAVYQRGKSQSFFANATFPNPPYRLLSQSELKQYDEVSEEVWPESLHHQVWLGLKSRSHFMQSKECGPHPNQISHVFRELQFSIYNQHQAAPDSLCRLDIDAFLNAAILCASALLDEEQIGDFVNPDRLPTLPADITKTLCTSAQQKWWSSAYKMYSKQKLVENNIGEIRQELQRGLEVVRCIGNHGLHPVLIVHLARIFQYRAKLLKEKDKDHSDIPALEARCELYWSNAVPLLDRLHNNQTVRITNSTIFHYQGKDLTDAELIRALEEGKLLLTQRFLREKQYEQAIDALHALKCPEASFQQGKIYKKIADELVGTMARESLTSEIRSQHIIMLSHARNCFYLTLDRLRSPGINPKHPLNSELCTHISDIENELKRIDPNFSHGDFSRNECDGMSEESYSSAQSGGDNPISHTAIPTLTGLSSSVNVLGTPQRNTHRPPKQTSTPCRLQHQDILDLSRSRNEARPSPERLDAQIRQLIYSKDIINTIMEQNKIIIEKLDGLEKGMAELMKDRQKQRSQPVNVNPNLEEDLYVLGEEDYNDLNYNAPQAGPAPVASNIFTPPHRQGLPQWRIGSSPLVHPPATPFQGYYQGGMAFTDPNTQPVPPLYATNFYPMPILYPNGTKMQENLLQSGLFPSRMPTQIPDLMPPNQPLQLPIHKVETLKPDMMTSIPQTSISMSAMHPSSIPPSMVQPSMVQPPMVQPPMVQPPMVQPPMVQPPMVQPPMVQPPISSTSLSTTGVPMATTPAPSIMPAVPIKTATTTTVVKDAPVNKVPPVNVVITTSDVLPTTAPPVQPTLSVTIPAQHRLGTVPIMSIASPTIPITTAPHRYQLSMPPQPTIPTTVNLPALSTTLTTSAPSVPAPITETSGMPKNQPEICRVPAPIPKSPREMVETEHDPLPDFAPVIPMPDEVKVTTGEENEETLYSARAKLFRFVDKEWKERGVGNVKLLKNSEGKVRLLMRRDQVLKICANHLITSDMNLTQHPTNEKALIWVANDFADEQVRLEKLCIRFKTTEEAAAFKEHFDKAKTSLPISPAKPVSTSSKSDSASDIGKDLGKASEQSSSKSHRQKQGGAVITSTSAPSPTLETTKSTTTTFAGLTFTTPPKIPPASTSDSTKAASKSEASKSNPFTAFAFGKSSATATSQPPSFPFGKQSTAATSSIFPTTTTTATTAWKTEPANTTTSTSVGSKNQVPLSELFKPAAGSWKCDICCVSNKPADNYCVACETPKDPSLPPKPKTSGFQLDTASSAVPTFSFGIPPDANKDTSGAFTFRLTTPTNKTSTEAAEPEASAKPDTTGAKFVFGMQQKPTTPSTKDAQFTFGSPGKAFDFNFVAKSPGGGDCSEEEVVESEDIDFKPVIPLPDRIDPKTGEEDEEVLYSHRAKLFKYDKSAKQWKERGLGDIKLLKHKETGKLRLVMRRDQILKLCLNHFVLPDLEFTSKDDKTWMWNAGDYSSEEIEYNQFACRFKTSEIAQEFRKAVDDARKNQKESSVSGKSKVASLDEKSKAKEASVDNDIEIVFEAIPPENESAVTEALKLPRNFFSYKQKPDCPGCRGCKEPEIPLFENTSTAPLSVSQISNTSVESKISSTVTIPNVPTTTPMTFGKMDEKKDDVKKTFNFGSALTIQSTTPNKQNAFSPENLKICSPSTSVLTSEAEPSVVAAPATTSQSVFRVPLTDASSTLTSPSNTSMFGGRAANTDVRFDATSMEQISNGTSPEVKSPIFKPSSLNIVTVSSALTFSGNFSQPKTTTTTLAPTTASAVSTFSFSKPSLFGSNPSQVNNDSTNRPSSVAPNTTNTGGYVFGMATASSATPFSSKLSFGINANNVTPFGTSSMIKESTSDVKSEENVPDKEQALSFLEKPNLTFSALAAKAPPKLAFKIDPTFSFAGAGSSVFGSKREEDLASVQKQNASTNEDKHEDNEEDQANDQDEHDPHFEPVVPMPDVIEVRTGEEDEQKLFCERAKLYRFDSNERQWKERGVGEMKVLHHAQHGTYRLLLRREQVHKVVCNFRLSPDVTFSKLAQSDHSYVWAGMNHVEGTSALEKLAIRFKNADLAKKFKKTVDGIQETLRDTKDKQEVDTSRVEEPDEDDDDDDKDDDDDGDEEDEYDNDDCEDEESEEEDEHEVDVEGNNENYDEDDEREDDDDSSIVFEKRAKIVIKEDGEEKGNRMQGYVTIYCTPTDAPYRIVLKANKRDASDKMISTTVADNNMQIEISKQKCTWSAVDYALQPPRRRTLKAIFSSTSVAEHMMKLISKEIEIWKK